jgi:hypothetical protein
MQHFVHNKYKKKRYPNENQSQRRLITGRLAYSLSYLDDEV